MSDYHNSDQVCLILDQNFKSERLKIVFRTFFTKQQEMKYYKILSHAFYKKIYCLKNGSSFELPKKLKENREFLKILLEYYGIFMKHMDKDIRNDRELCLIAVKSNAIAFSFIGEDLKSDFDIIMATMTNSTNKSNFDIREYLFKTWPELGYCEDFFLHLEGDEYILKYAAKTFLSSKEFMLQAVKQNKNAILYASEELKCDRELVMEVMLRGPFKMNEFLVFLRNEEFVMEYIERSKTPSILEYADISIRNNRRIALESVKKNASEFRFINKDIRGFDREIGLLAVEKDGELLRYVAAPLIYDKDIVKKAIENNPIALRYAKNFRDDREVVQFAISKNRHVLIHASQRFQDEFQTLVEDQPTDTEWNIEKNMLQYWTEKIKISKDRKDVLEAVQIGFNPFDLNYPNIGCDREIMLEAIKKESLYFLKVENSYTLNRSFVRQAIRNNIECLELLRDHFLLDKEFILDACAPHQSFINALPSTRKYTYSYYD